MTADTHGNFASVASNNKGLTILNSVCVTCGRQGKQEGPERDTRRHGIIY